MNPNFCGHYNTWYKDGDLYCSDCRSTGLGHILKETDFPATFKQIFEDLDTGFAVTKINNHVDKHTFFRAFDRNVEMLIETNNLQAALAAGAPRLVKLDNNRDDS